MARSEASKRAQDKFDKKITKITFRLNPDSPDEKRIITFLNESGNKQGVIKEALSKYIADKRDGTAPSK